MRVIMTYNLGTVYAEQGLVDNAIEQYRLAVKFYPGFAEAINNLGVAYEKKG
jgi:tetratricopeptide (TPR) repeat protein